MKRLAAPALAAMLVLLVAAPVLAEQPSRVRELTCSDGTEFVGEQVRAGFGTPPHTFRNVVQGQSPAAFVFQAATVTAPDGTLIEPLSWDNSQGVAVPFELITCSFIIPIGELAGYEAGFIGYFVP